MAPIHPTAVVDPGAKLADDVSVGAFCYVGPDVELDAGVELRPHALVTGRTRIGPRTRVFSFAVLGEEPQDKSFQGETTRLEIGADNVSVVEGPLAEGWREQAPYSLVVIAGGVASVPDAIADQVADGGRLVTVVRDAGGLGRASLFKKVGTVLSGRVVFDAATPVLPGFERETGFVF